MNRYLTTLTTPRPTLSLVMVLGLFLVGCQSLPDKMRQDLQLVTELSQRCEVIQNAFSLPEGDNLADRLNLRLRLKLTGSICIPEVSESTLPECPISKGVPQFDFGPTSTELKQLRNHLGATKKALEGHFGPIESELTIIKASEERIRRNIRQMVSALDAALNSDRLKDIEDVCGKSVRLKCGAKVADVITKFAEELQGKHYYQALVADLEVVQSATERIATAADVIGKAKNLKDEELAALASARAVIVQLKELVSRADRIFAEGIRVTGLVLAADGEVVFDELFVHRMKYRAADRFITMSENQFARLDKLVDKADERLLMAGSFGLWFWQDDIQDVFDRAVTSFAKEALDKLDFALAFGTAGCDHLEKSPPPPTMFAPFLNRAIVKMAAGSLCVRDKKDNKACQERIFAAASSDEVCAKDADCNKKRAANLTSEKSLASQSEFAKVISEGQKAAFDGSEVKVSSMDRYGACYASRIAAQSGLIVAEPESTGRTSTSNLVARTCGNMVAVAESDGRAGVTKELDGESRPGVLVQKLRVSATYATASTWTSNQYFATTINNNTTLNKFDTPRLEPRPPQPMRACDLLEGRFPGMRCREIRPGSIEITIPSLYAEGEFQSEKSYAAILQLADATKSLGGRFAAEIGGTTSSSSLSCSRIVARIGKARMLKRDVPNVDRPMRVEPVGVAGSYEVRVPRTMGQPVVVRAVCFRDEQANKFLAVLRAATAADLLARNASQSIESITVLADEVGSPAPFVATQDRGLVVTLRTN